MPYAARALHSAPRKLRYDSYEALHYVGPVCLCCVWRCVGLRARCIVKVLIKRFCACQLTYACCALVRHTGLGAVDSTPVTISWRSTSCVMSHLRLVFASTCMKLSRISMVQCKRVLSLLGCSLGDYWRLKTGGGLPIVAVASWDSWRFLVQACPAAVFSGRATCAQPNPNVNCSVRSLLSCCRPGRLHSCFH